MFMSGRKSAGIRKPEPSSPRFKPPDGLSPAAARFVWRMGYDRKAYSAALINMAVKGFMTIEDEGETYRLRHAADQSDETLTNGEKQIANALSLYNNSILLDNTDHRRISKSIGRLKNSLRNEFEKVFFLTNRKHFYIGLAITTLALFVTALLTSGAPIILFLGVWLVVWTTGCVFLLDRVVTQWRDVFSGGNPFGSTGLAIFLSIFALPFFGAEVGVLSYFWTQVPMLLLLSFVGLGGINILFFYLLQAPTRAGRAVMDEIEGFRQYLSVAEKERLDLLNPPEKTPDLFEKYLPYALALDVENEWSKQFTDVLTRAAQGNPEHGAYRPRWYSGRRWNTYGANGFGSNLSASLSSSVASAARAPGSSSGSGGGGFSGGGGGW